MVAPETALPRRDRVGKEVTIEPFVDDRSRRLDAEGAVSIRFATLCRHRSAECVVGHCEQLRPGNVAWAGRQAPERQLAPKAGKLVIDEPKRLLQHYSARSGFFLE